MERGGKREGSGRKPKTIKIVRKVMAEAVLAGIDETAAWRKLLQSKDERIALESLKYLTNRRDGLPAQSIALKDETPQRQPLASEYIESVKIALGITGVLTPIRSEPEPTPGLPRPRALPD